METFRARVVSALTKLSAEETKHFGIYLRHVGEEPRVSKHDLEMATKPEELAELLLKRYALAGTPRVLVQGLEKVRRNDLVSEWESMSRMNLKRPYEYDNSELDCYNMDRARKAFVMCVTTGRPGAEQDIKKIKNWLEKCKFEYISCDDPDEKELFEKLTQFRDGINELKEEVSCCLVTLMAHGGKGFIRTKSDERVSLSDIFKMFNNENCPALQEKPKIFIIQACRGVKKDGGVVQTDDEPDEPMELDVLEKKRLPTLSDYYTIYSTQEDYVAVRHPREGSAMIQAIDEVFQQHGKKWHIADFFTQVNNQVVHTDFYKKRDQTTRNSSITLDSATRDLTIWEPIKVVLVMESTLTKAVYF